MNLADFLSFFAVRFTHTHTTEPPPMASVNDILKGAVADTADAKVKADAAIEANNAAKAAADKSVASNARAARMLHKTGEVFVRADDGTVTTFDSPDGLVIVSRSPKDAATLDAPDDSAPVADSTTSADSSTSVIPSSEVTDNSVV